MPHELIMPKMGESIMEATILRWVKNVGDTVDVDETILEIATDKVDSEVPSPVSGKISKIFFQENDVVEIGKVIAFIEVEGEEAGAATTEAEPTSVQHATANGQTEDKPKPQEKKPEPQPALAEAAVGTSSYTNGNRFYSPLVRNIAAKENIGLQELETVPGTGMGGRVTKKDILAYLEARTQETPTKEAAVSVAAPTQKAPAQTATTPPPPPTAPGDHVEIIEMDRMRRLIADHMVMSKQTSPHVTSFVEVDVTDIVNWRNRIKKSFQEKHGEKITFTPIFVEAVVKAIQDFPMVNISVDGNRMIRKKDINIGMAAALPSGNLIVPVIRKADHLSLLGLTKSVNDLAGRARANQLKPEEIQGGTFTLTNVGTFGNVMGTPIINQPQVAILATGAIRKKPAVVETEYGDLIAVRHMMFLSLSYDHRVVDGALGGSFLRKVGDYLEAFDANRQI
jgi:2-oxoglutarate dehydrogenase E2 component (dihydrolipoamide succinyltransferase)